MATQHHALEILPVNHFYMFLLLQYIFEATYNLTEIVSR